MKKEMGVLFVIALLIVFSGCKGGGREVTPPPEDPEVIVPLPPSPPSVINLTQATLKTVGVKLDSSFSSNGKFQVQILVEEPSLETTEKFMDETKGAVETMDCEITSDTSLGCDCPDSLVTQPASSALDIAIDIDSSGSNVPTPGTVDEVPPSDPTNQRLGAANAVIDALLTGENRVAAYDFGTTYCNYPKNTTCPEGTPEGDFYRGLSRVGWVTYRFAPLTGVDGREALKDTVKKAIWQKSNGTPLYDSLIDVMDEMDDAINRTSARLIVLFSDGMPNNNYYSYTSVCDQAVRSGTKIFAIGYGQASLHDELKDPEAVAVLQKLASCSNGTYLPIQEIDQIVAAATDLSKGITQGSLDSQCQLPSDKAPLLDRSRVVEGKVVIKFKNVSEQKETGFSFIPSTEVQPSMLRTRPQQPVNAP